jgi:hypothetical protein
MRRRGSSTTIVTALVTLTLVTGGCVTEEVADGPGTTTPTSASPTTSAPAPAGWLGGEPEWTAAPSATEAPAAAGGVADGGAEEAYASTDRASVAEGEPMPPVDPAQPLRAGNVDDNVDLAAFESYLDRIAGLGIITRDYDPTGRVIVRVRGVDDRPVAGAEVVVSADGTEVARLRTTADGTVRFHPALHGAAAATELVVAVGDQVVEPVLPGTSVDVTLSAPGGATAPVPMDVHFLLDTTGSMGDEIDRLKTSIDSIAERLASLPAAPDLRLGMTVYRDEGDAFVTSTFDLTSDVPAFRTALADVVADGGGDYPEALDEGLAEALAGPSWRDPASTLQFVVLVADAPPQIGRQVPVPYTDSIRDAVARGIKVFPIASSESDDQAEAVFRQIAQATGARFVFLSYGAGGAATGGSTDIDTTDYEELALDDLIVRLLSEELAALTGDTVPPPPPPVTTVPDGQ